MNKIIVNKDEFLKTLISASCMATKNRMPLLEYAKIMVQNLSMRIVSNNGEIAVSQSCPIVEATSDCKFCIIPRDLIGYIKLVKDDEIALELNDTMDTLTVIHSKGKTNIPIASADDFPTPLTEKEPVKINMQSKILSDILDISTPFLGHEDLRPVLSCLYLEFSEKGICFAASDTHILITDTIPCELKGCPTIETLIHFNAFKPLSDILRLSDTINIRIGEKQVVFSNNEASVSCTIVEGHFPSFRSIIPQHFDMEVKDVGIEELGMAIERCRLVNDNIKINLEKGRGLTIQAYDLMSTKNNAEEVSCQCDDNLEIGFHTNAILNSLKGVVNPKCSLYLNGSDKAMILKDEKVEKFILVMPVRLASN